MNKKGTYTAKDLKLLGKEFFEAYVADILTIEPDNRKQVFYCKTDYNQEPDYNKEDIWTFMKDNMKVANFEVDLEEKHEDFLARVRESSSLIESHAGKSSDEKLESQNKLTAKYEKQVQGLEQPACSTGQQHGCQSPNAEEAKVSTSNLPRKRTGQSESKNPSKRSKVPKKNERREEEVANSEIDEESIFEVLYLPS
jgi:hypothetical protein